MVAHTNITKFQTSILIRSGWLVSFAIETPFTWMHRGLKSSPAPKKQRFSNSRREHAVFLPIAVFCVVLLLTFKIPPNCCNPVNCKILNFPAEKQADDSRIATSNGWRMLP